MGNALALFLRLQALVQAGLQIYETIAKITSLIARASAENRDLSEAEIAEVNTMLDTTDAAWQEQLQKLRAGGNPA